MLILFKHLTLTAGESASVRNQQIIKILLQYINQYTTLHLRQKTKVNYNSLRIWVLNTDRDFIVPTLPARTR